MSGRIVGRGRRAALLFALMVALGGAWLVSGAVSGAAEKRSGKREASIARQTKAVQVAQRRAQASRARRGGAAARARRLRSRTVHEGLGPGAARALLWRSFPTIVAEPVFDASADGLGARVVRRLDSHQAVVEGPGGRHALVQSTVPLSMPGGPDEGDAVDLSLRPAGGAIEPAQGLVPTRLGARAEDGVRFPEQGFGHPPEGGEGRRAGDRRPRVLRGCRARHRLPRHADPRRRRDLRAAALAGQPRGPRPRARPAGRRGRAAR